MTIKHKPATALPWEFRPDATEANPYWRGASMWSGGACVVRMDFTNAHGQGAQNAAYIAHAANAYPRLVAALRAATARLQQETDGDAWTLHQQGAALLRELGEDA